MKLVRPELQGQMPSASNHCPTTNCKMILDFTLLRLSPLIWKEELKTIALNNYYETKIGGFKFKSLTYAWHSRGSILV